ncbi:MAG: hypothetical protein RIT25_1099 [Planctomycetota bacterium]|jgi:anti-anti-sigma factor
MTAGTELATLRRDGDILIVVLPLRLDGSNGEGVLRQVEGAVQEDCRVVAFDCTATEFVSSAGIRVFTAVARRVRPTGGRVAAAAVRPMVRQVFEFAGIVPFIDLHADLASALGSMT